MANAIRLVGADVEAPTADGFRPATLHTGRGAVRCRHYPVPGADRAAVWVGGVGGGWDTPANALYPRLCRAFLDQGIASLRVRFRKPGNLAEAVHDVRAGVRFLEDQGIGAVAVTGHSFGGAVVIRAAAWSDAVRAAVTLATQSHGADPVAELGPRCALLLLHGDCDDILPWTCSATVFKRARQPKRLRILEGAGHVLDEAADIVEQEVRAWLPARLDEAVRRPSR